MSVEGRRRPVLHLVDNQKGRIGESHSGPRRGIAHSYDKPIVRAAAWLTEGISINFSLSDPDGRIGYSVTATEGAGSALSLFQNALRIFQGAVEERDHLRMQGDFHAKDTTKGLLYVAGNSIGWEDGSEFGSVPFYDRPLIGAAAEIAEVPITFFHIPDIDDRVGYVIAAQDLRAKEKGKFLGSLRILSNAVGERDELMGNNHKNSQSTHVTIYE